MKQTVQKRATTLYVFHYPFFIIIAVLFLMTLGISKTSDIGGNHNGDVLGKGNTNQDNKDKGNKSDKEGQGKSGGNQGAGSINAATHKVNTQEVVENLRQISDEEDQAGNEETGEDIDEVALDEEEAVDEVTEAIKAVETRSKWKTLLLGSDYKNLGQLRSSLAHNTNSIRQLSKSQDEVLVPGNEAEVQTQLQLMLQERERIRNVIMANESEFGLLGWVFRFLNGYMLGGLDDDIGEYVDVPESTESTGSMPQ